MALKVSRLNVKAVEYTIRCTTWRGCRRERLPALLTCGRSGGFGRPHAAAALAAGKEIIRQQAVCRRGVWGFVGFVFLENFQMKLFHLGCLLVEAPFFFLVNYRIF